MKLSTSRHIKLTEHSSTSLYASVSGTSKIGAETLLRRFDHPLDPKICRRLVEYGPAVRGTAVASHCPQKAKTQIAAIEVM